MHGTAFSTKPRSELLEYAIALHQNPPESIGAFPIVRAVLLIFIERYRVFNLVRHLVNRHRQMKLVQSLHHGPVKIGNGTRFQVNRSPLAIARVDVKLVINEIKSNFERAYAVRDRRSR
jgi:hypothetical protein